MDPDATLARLLDAILADDWQDASTALADLRAWREHGGFGPTDPRPDPLSLP